MMTMSAKITTLSSKADSSGWVQMTGGKQARGKTIQRPIKRDGTSSSFTLMPQSNNQAPRLSLIADIIHHQHHTVPHRTVPTTITKIAFRVHAYYCLRFNTIAPASITTTTISTGFSTCHPAAQHHTARVHPTATTPHCTHLMLKSIKIPEID